ncbi:MAG TPA: twin-arginine translocation signal domain-containing protein, partial [Burkholderiaceae bacterium]|nr:twin-arginine translocation signal domain-containing protein [Burkholderiaceae bacterium]
MSHLERREFLQVLGAAAVAGFGLGRSGEARAASPYDLPAPFRGAGSVSLLHMTDCHAQLLPLYFR